MLAVILPTVAPSSIEFDAPVAMSQATICLAGHPSRVILRKSVPTTFEDLSGAMKTLRMGLTATTNLQKSRPGDGLCNAQDVVITFVFSNLGSVFVFVNFLVHHSIVRTPHLMNMNEWMVPHG